MKKSSRFLLCLIFIFIYTFTRIPIIVNGYGLDSDAWRMAKTGSDLVNKGIYNPSRPPGYPEMELLLAYLDNPLIANIIVCVLSIVCLYAYNILLKIYACKNTTVAILVISSLPLFWIYSATSMDYIPSLAFIMLAFAFVEKKLFLIAGLSLAIAIAFRPPNVILFPAIIYYVHISKRDYIDVIAFISILLLSLLILLKPLFNLEIIKMLIPMGTNIPLLLQIKMAVYRAYNAFDLTGWVAIFIGISTWKDVPLKIKRILMFVFIPFIIMWIFIPHESAYWLSITPFIILLIYSVNRSFKYDIVIAILLILPAFVSVSLREKTDNDYIFKPNIAIGQIFSEIQQRQKLMELRVKIANTNFDNDAIVLAGRSSAIFELNDGFHFFGEIGGHDVWKSVKNESLFTDGFQAQTIDSLKKSGHKIYILIEAVPSAKLSFGWRPDDLGVNIIDDLSEFSK